MLRLRPVLVVAALVAPLAPAFARAGEHVFPERNDDRATRDATWTPAGTWQVSTPEAPLGGGTRVSALLSVIDAQPVALQARGVATDASGRCSEAAGAGPWLPLRETFARGEARIAVVDLDGHHPCAQLRIADGARIGDLQWELLVPRHPDAGARARALAAELPPVRAVVPELQQIGVVPREEWGALPGGCSDPETDWYRMAIHHTAGPQTADGTVQGRLQVTQAYAMDSGEWCDIPYQMLVGYDGSLWEGRGLELYSGATGGGNNDGNLAVCFIGCYHEPDADCVGGEGHDVTDAMMQRGQLLVQTLVRLHDISTAVDNIQGHRDWPGNSTACPGSLLHPRLEELRADLTWFAAAEADRSWTEAVIEVELGTTRELWIDLENTGGLPWTPDLTFLAPTPRDQPSELGDASWPSPIRAATPGDEVAPGEVGRFTFTVSASSTEPVVQSFGLVHEGVTWFADAPWGGGPTDDAFTITVVGVEASGTTSGTTTTSADTSGDGQPPSGDTTDGASSGGESTGAPAADDAGDDGCGCASDRGAEPRGAGWLAALVTVLGLRRRATARRRCTSPTR
ncbi:MAG: N-acetylmuramoyl-L-alanine amidase [Myxococcales bacterium]|nr:N-acetylmuramoyl-L-alanine amidase [Myxococcales bacterium]